MLRGIIGGILLPVFVVAAEPFTASVFPEDEALISGPGAELRAGFPNLPLTLVSQSRGAACLDGSAPGYYTERDAKERHAATKGLVFFFQGGGWYTSPEDAYARSKTRLGTSRVWPTSIPPRGALNSPSPAENPDLDGFAHVYVPYCDGASFSGTKEDPAVVNGTKIFSRGRINLEAVLADLHDKVGFGAATETLIVTGSSAGGLATILHADSVARWAPNARTVAVPQSGYFLDVDNAAGAPHYRDWMSFVTDFSGAISGVNADCAAALGATEPWKCFMAPYAVKFVQTPLFLLNSHFDAWQMGNVLQLSSECVAKGPSACSTDEISSASAFASTLVANISATLPATGAAFVTSCWTHATFQYPAGWSDVIVDSVNASSAFHSWFHSGRLPNVPGGREPSLTTNDIIDDCTNDVAGERTCNPTCAK